MRYFDSRRKLVKLGLDQPVVVDDFEYDSLTQGDVVRKLFLDPDIVPDPKEPIRGQSSPLSHLIEEPVVSGAAEEPVSDFVEPAVLRDSEELPHSAGSRGGLSEEAMHVERARKLLRDGAMIAVFLGFCLLGKKLHILKKIASSWSMSS